MIYRSVLRKMRTSLAEEVNYFLDMDTDIIHMNQLLNREIAIYFVKYECLNCHKAKKIFRQGFCYDCFQASAKVGDWIMKPELSTAHLDQEDRDLDYEKKVQLQPHIVYLANSSDVKVGVTRKTQVPTRWIDQGAHEAIEVVEVPNRYLAGLTEVALKEHVADKTNWRTMLKNEIEDKNLVDIKNQLREFIPDEAQEYFIENNQEVEIHFPVLNYPKKLKSLNLSKKDNYRGKLVGIKGQYLIFQDDTVFNVRNNEGFVVDLELH
ncbi:MULTISPECIES: DUF2797 domain-containing protein [Psychroflexus]|uniref:DUF2797 domain-containing protein n=1 Tax=Psychroflexus halocasei TaxID=908615 RepID=A0A1H3YPQ5_9FLAO|nr:MULTISPECIES: DUF2797 domain-containing protein [Psychroflexus]PJX24487.1 hypothetical protein CAP47_03070 [Psychroflexus sp. S27]SEA13357.1 Protein of unknown function [Psychroflexus halocasei]